MGRGLSVGLVAALIVAALLAGCGSSASGSGAAAQDPATAAPASTIAYVALAVRPEGEMQSEIETSLTKLFGSSPDAPLQQAAQKLLSKLGTSYSDIRPWLGQRIALIATELSPSGLALIAPTNDPSSAKSFISTALKRVSGHTPTTTSYHGVSLEQVPLSAFSLQGGVIGHFAVVGGPSAVEAIDGAIGGPSLASQPRFADAMQSAPADSALSVYVSVKPLLEAYSSLPQLQGLLGGAGASTLSTVQKTLAKLQSNASVAAELAFSPSQIELNLSSQGLPTKATSNGSPADVGALPSSTWAGLMSGGTLSGAMSRGFSQGFQRGFQRGLSLSTAADGLDPGLLEGKIQQTLGFNLADVGGLVGPFKLGVSGTSLRSVAATLAITPSDAAEAGRVLSAIRAKVKTSGLEKSYGTGSSFAVTDPKLGGHEVTVLDSGRQIVVRFGPGTAPASAFLSPSSTLAGTSAYQSAEQTLPSGAHVTAYLSFPALLSLVESSPKTGTATDQRVEAVLKRLGYAIVGGASGDYRVVLGLN